MFINKKTNFITFNDRGFYQTNRLHGFSLVRVPHVSYYYTYRVDQHVGVNISVYLKRNEHLFQTRPTTGSCGGGGVKEEK